MAQIDFGQELYKAFGQVKDFTLGVSIAKHFYEMGEKKDKTKKLEKLADAMYFAAFNLTTDASKLRKAMRDYYQFVIKELNE